MIPDMEMEEVLARDVRVGDIIVSEGKRGRVVVIDVQPMFNEDSFYFQHTGTWPNQYYMAHDKLERLTPESRAIWSKFV